MPPFALAVTVTDSGSAVASVNVNFRNERTSEILTVTTNSEGKGLEDANNFASGSRSE